MAKNWTHPGGKLREEGADRLTEVELLSILISPGIKEKPALHIAGEIIDSCGSLAQLADSPLEELLNVRGLSHVKVIRLAAALELARRLGDGTMPIPRYGPPCGKRR